MCHAGIIIFTCRNVIGYIFSSDSAVVATVALIAPYVALFEVLQLVKAKGVV